MERALVVESLESGPPLVGHALVDAGFSVCFASSPSQALELLESERPDLIVTDHRDSGLDAVALVRSVRAVSAVPIVVLTACGSIADCERAMRAGANRFLQLRRDLDRLGAVAREVVETAEACPRAGARLTTEEARALGRRQLRSRLQHLVIECRGNIAEIARRMDRDRSTVRYHLRRMGLLD